MGHAQCGGTSARQVAVTAPKLVNLHNLGGCDAHVAAEWVQGKLMLYHVIMLPFLLEL